MGIFGPPYTKNGIAKISGGLQQFAIPSRTIITSESVTTLNVNEARYIPMYLDYAITISALQFEVTTTPVSNANARVGIYLADTNLQPSGAPIYDSGNIAVANGFTGAKTLTGLAIAVPQAVCLTVINIDTAMGVRTFISGTTSILAGAGANGLNQRFTVAQTFGAFPTPGTAWTTISSGTGGFQHIVSYQWSE